MKYFIQFQTESSGMTYKNGQIIDAPKFPIDAIGSDSVFILDGRNNLEAMKNDAVGRLSLLQRKCNFIGYKIMKGTRFTDSKELFNSLK